MVAAPSLFANPKPQRRNLEAVCCHVHRSVHRARVCVSDPYGVGQRKPPAIEHHVDDVPETDHDHSGGDIDDDPTPDHVDDPVNDGSADNDASLDDNLAAFIDDLNAVLNHFYNAGPDDDDIVNGSDEPDPGDEHQ